MKLESEGYYFVVFYTLRQDFVGRLEKYLQEFQFSKSGKKENAMQ